MTPSFSSILQQHTAAYPLMAPQDYGKLAYQNEFGPGHMISDKQAAFDFLLREWREAARPSSPDEGAVSGAHPAPPLTAEPIGNGLCRFHLDGSFCPEEAAPLLTELFCRTALEHTGTREGLEQKLALLPKLGIPRLAQWLEDYRARGCPPVHHSEAFRQAYHPHYRVLRSEYAFFFKALLLLRGMLEGKGAAPVVAAVDGRCGSGKTGFSRLAESLFPCAVLHVDDFYLPEQARESDWRQTPARNIDFDKLLNALNTLRAGKPVSFSRFDCAAGRLGAPFRVEPQPLIVLEGSYSMHPRLSGAVDKAIFLTCSAQEQQRRLTNRRPGGIDAFEALWIPLEERYFERFGIPRLSELVLDTSLFFQDLPGEEF